jgi:hypothetical protein
MERSVCVGEWLQEGGGSEGGRDKTTAHEQNHPQSTPHLPLLHTHALTHSHSHSLSTRSIEWTSMK